MRGCLLSIEDAQPSDMRFEQRMAAAYLAGRSSAVAGQRRRNPYDGNAATAVERVLSRNWTRGYSAGNPFRAGGQFDPFAGHGHR